MKIKTRTHNKEITKTELLNKASKILLRKGIKSLSINEVMNGVGLTRGSFYVYFKSKSDMISQAFVFSIEASNQNVKDYLNKNSHNPKDTYATFINFYLSDFHKNNPDIGCPISALANDFAHSNLKQRIEFSRLLSVLFEKRRKLVQINGEIISREKWIGITSCYIGAMILSRATNNTELSDEILSAAKKNLLVLGEIK